jgi:hypothetical protein
MSSRAGVSRRRLLTTIPLLPFAAAATSSTTAVRSKPVCSRAWRLVLEKIVPRLNWRDAKASCVASGHDAMISQPAALSRVNGSARQHKLNHRRGENPGKFFLAARVS